MIDLKGIAQSLQNIVTALNKLNVTAAASLPQIGPTTFTSATAGSATLPANPVAFGEITIDGTTYKFPLYNP